jgi:oligopeptide transport system ATP-binding protein
MTVFDAIAEPLLAHRIVERSKLNEAVAELMEKVGLAPRFMKKYPHEFSGGQRQRIAIARSLAPRPNLIIADEPVSALDVSVQAQILNLIAGLCRRERLTMIFISHDLAVVRHIAKTIAVMYLGRIVEQGDARGVFDDPLHPYTQALISAVPLPDPEQERNRRRIILRGDPPSPLDPPSGCPFHPRCPIAEAQCALTVPRLEEKRLGRRVSCLRVEKLHFS